MPNIVKIKSSKTASNVPTSLEDGEIAINQTDKVLFYTNQLGVVQSFSLVASGGSGGGSGWTYVKLLADAATTLTSNVDTLLRFTPDANSHYEVEGKFFLESVATTTGVRPGIKWSTSGLLRNVAWIVSPTSATAFVSRFWGNTVAANAASTAVPVANEGLYGEVNAMFVTAATVAGDFVITIASEIAGSQVKINGDSYIRYRKVI
jgi:hypothetical protein